jgi:glycosyltransferase involved in cell wall biosynthesis
MKESLEDKNSPPAVTILMASYGRLVFLNDAVNSALNQHYPNYQILFIDYGSEPAVIEWLQSLESSEPGVSVVYQSHQGVAAARAKGLEKAETDLVCILDSDDWLVENALETLVAAISRKTGTQLVFANIREIRANGESGIRTYVQYNSSRAMTLATLMKPRVPFKHSGSLFRRQTALALGSYDINLPCKVDIDLYLKFLEADYLPEHVDEVLVDFRMHKDSVSIDRLTGIKVWIYLINRYGPVNPIYRLIIKSIRISAELLKSVYMQIKG